MVENGKLNMQKSRTGWMPSADRQSADHKVAADLVPRTNESEVHTAPASASDSICYVK